MSEPKRYYAEKFEFSAVVDGIGINVRMRLMLDRENKRVRAVRSVHVTAADGSKLPTANEAYIDDYDGQPAPKHPNDV